MRRKQEELAQAKEEAAADNDVPTDDYYRIPAIMQDCKAAYDLTWKGEGWWSGYTYLREAVAPNINGVITFRASCRLPGSRNTSSASRYTVPLWKSVGS